MQFELDFPYALGAPTATGVIRQAVCDFEVIEVLGFEPSGAGEHVYLWIEKRGANTGWVAAQLAAFAGLRDFDVSYAGKKDRHAVTRQWLSAWLPKADPDFSQLALPGVSILRAARHSKKLRRGMHEGNRFRIRIRQLEGDRNDLQERLGKLRRDGFPNYFGEQRFGIDGNNLQRADEMFKGQRTQRSKKEIYLSAARGYLFNRQLAREVDAGTWCERDESGASRSGWLYGKTRDDHLLPRDDALSTWEEGLVRFDVKAMLRPLAVVPDELEWTFEPDALVVNFGLPSGAYATSLLREIVQYGRLTAGEDPVLG